MPQSELRSLAGIEDKTQMLHRDLMQRTLLQYCLWRKCNLQKARENVQPAKSVGKAHSP